MARGEPGARLCKSDWWDKFEQAGLDELRVPGESRTAFLLRYTLSHPHVDTIIVGTLQPEHLMENVQAAEGGPLSFDVCAKAKRKLAEAGAVPAQTGA